VKRLWDELAIAIHCWRHGHDYAEQRPTRCVSVNACRWCGNYRGAKVLDRSTCAWYRPEMTRNGEPS
jgi:hypothetical protein